MTLNELLSIESGMHNKILSMWNIYTVVILAIVGAVFTKSFRVNDKRLLVFGLAVLALFLFSNAYSIYGQLDNADQITRLIRNFESFDQNKLNPMEKEMVSKYNRANRLSPNNIICFHIIIDVALLAIVIMSNKENLRKKSHDNDIQDA